MKVFLLVLDGAGIGAAKDCQKFNDPPTVNTIFNSIKKTVEENIEITLPNLSKLGLHKILQLKNPSITNEILQKLGFNTSTNIISSYGIMEEKSQGKDTITGHWEIAGIIQNQGFQTFQSFPQNLIQEFEKRINRKIIGNKAASGTEIIKELGKEHIQTGYPIVYTSADSVFQIAAHIKTIPLDELYQICQIAFDLIREKNYRIARVIARPFDGENDNFFRLNDKRKDFSIPPPSKTVLDVLYNSNLEVITVGKVAEIFANKSITKSYKISGNENIIRKVIELTRENFEGLVFANLVDFDTIYGHRQDYKGWAKALEQFDNLLPNLIGNLAKDDVLIITADHGNDPTDQSTDHTREDVPIIILGIGYNKCLGIKPSFRFVSFIIQSIFNNKIKDKINIEEFEGEKIW